MPWHREHSYVDAGPANQSSMTGCDLSDPKWIFQKKKKITDIEKLFIFHSIDNQPAPCQHPVKCTCLLPFATEMELNPLSRYLGENMDV